MQDLKAGGDPESNRTQTPKNPGSDSRTAADPEPESDLTRVKGPFAALRYAVNRRCAALLARVIAWLDRNAARQGGEWGARMEYKRRYTNPDEAVRAREPLPERRKGERRS
jgi:hypothetical protein